MPTCKDAQGRGLVTIAEICAIYLLAICSPPELPSKNISFVPYERINIPVRAREYTREISRAAWTHFGTDDFNSALSGQIHQESYWRVRAKSPVGAAGLTQFMPATAIGESARCGLGVANVYNPSWAIQAQSCYMAHLYKRNYEFSSGCERFAATLSGYNGGQGNVNKQRRKWATATGNDPNKAVWFDGVVNYRVRGPSAHRENSHYPGRILLDLTPNYVAGGFGGKDICKLKRVKP